MARLMGENNPAKRPEVREKIRQALLGNKNGTKTLFQKGHPSFLGETGRLKLIGKPGFFKGKHLSEEHRKKISLSNLGKEVSIETREKLSKIRKERREFSHLWKGGITEINTLFRQSLPYRLWRESVFKRDNYTCQLCGERGGKLNADHVKSFSLNESLRLELSNGRTLCLECHKQTENYLNRWHKEEIKEYGIA